MNTVFQKLLILFLISVLFACKKDETPVLAASASFQIDGQNWESSELEILIERRQESSNVYVNSMQLTSHRNEDSYLRFIINDVRDAQEQECVSEDEYWGYDHPRSTESYFLEDGGIIYQNGARFELVPSEFSAHASLLGEVKISDCSDNKVSGSFQFTIVYPPVDTVTMVKGRFSNQSFEFVK